MTARSTSHHYYGQWVIANAIAEALGLGFTALLVVLMTPEIDSLGLTLLLALTMISAGLIIEGGAVGLGQGLVLRQWLPGFALQRWIVMTALGAGVAWTLGIIPSTLMSLTAEMTASSRAVEMSLIMILISAAVMGLLLGPVLALPQWWLLRDYLDQAWIWIPANALAWSLGMMLIFLAAGAVPAEASLVQIAVMLGLTLLLAGAVVGAVHGLVLFYRKPLNRVLGGQNR